MQEGNKFRKSDCNLKQLNSLLESSPIHKLRTTVANSSMTSLDFSNYRSTLSNNIQSRPSSNIPSFKKQSYNLKDQLSSLQDKVNLAKKQLKLNTTMI